MSKRLTLDEMIVLARECEPEGGQLRSLADTTARTIQLVTGNLCQALAFHLRVKPGKATYNLEARTGPVAAFHASRIGQPCPSPLRETGPSAWDTVKGQKLDTVTGEVA